jgi:23S rRNA (pseudouridine1915-N3)-methyltransferase
MRLRFVWIGATKLKELSNLEDRYVKRLERFFPLKRTVVPELRKTDPRQADAQLRREARAVESRLPSGTYLVALDERGEQMTSRQFAGFLERLLNRGVSETTFLIGGYLGIPEELKTKAEKTMSLSRLTLPHELARVVLLEQTYRAATILKGMPYHK